MILQILSIVISILLVGSILLQSQGSGLSNAFGGGGQVYRSKRSVERLLIWVTVVLTFLFAILSIILLLPH